MKRPNFFIPGAPKCGTTSMATWLGMHKRVYMCPWKEPHLFDTDVPRSKRVSLSEYERQFRKASDDHVAVGEASTGYLRSKVAIRNILEYSPNARFVVMLRSPIEMAYSLHNQQVYNGHETVVEFEKAWRLQFIRRDGLQIPKSCVLPHHLQYGEACSLGAQMEQLYETVSEERVLPVLLEDVQRNARTEYVRVLEFLGIEDDGREEFPVENKLKSRRSNIIFQLTRLLGDFKGKVGVKRSFGILRRTRRWNQKPKEKAGLPVELRKEVGRYFTKDVQKLQLLIGRDLSHWL